MRTTRATILGAAVLLLAASGAKAQYEKRKSTLAIADRVEVPGAILEPGTYLVRVADVESNRNVIVFESPDGSKTYATAIATPHRGSKTPSESEFTFYKTAPGEPRVLRTWFAPNDPNGQDFYYPAERAAALKNETHEEVPVATADMMPASHSSKASAETETSKSVVAPPPPPPPAPAPSETIASNETSASHAKGTDADTLPKTASPYPLIALLGLASLGAAAVLRKRREA
jgi:LPXTG-motif cell wall-anchored protein